MYTNDTNTWLLDKHVSHPDAMGAAHVITEEFDSVNKPAHYNQGGIECIDAIKAAVIGLEGIEAVCTANAIKYLWRWKYKNGKEDLEKAIWYINRLIKEYSGND